MSRLALAIDGHGGDGGLDTVLPAVVNKALENPSIDFNIVSNSCLPSEGIPANVHLVSANSIVGANTSAKDILKHHQQSSMAVALKLVRQGAADGCLTSGHTGPLVCLARALLRRIEGIKKVALVKPMPGGSYLLDLGANVHCSAEDLLSFAHMGVAYYQAIEQGQPSVCLLNVGHESNKGSNLVKQAHHLFSRSVPSYQGFVEADKAFSLASHVIVCEGFSGNIALKFGEGLAQYVSQSLKALLRGSTFLQPALKLVSHSRYNGACLLGVNGLVVKSHGAADQHGFSVALDRLIELANNQSYPRFNALWRAGLIKGSCL